MKKTLLTALLMTTGTLQAAPSERNPETGAEIWRVEQQGIAITLTQRIPEQTQAFFLARGFSNEAAKDIASACIFHIRLENRENDKSVEPDLGQWRRTGENGWQPLKLEADWQKGWENSGEAQGARIAFRWSSFPTRQPLEPSDWITGMSSLGNGTDDSFDLRIAWRSDEQLKQMVIPGLRCGKNP